MTTNFFNETIEYLKSKANGRLTISPEQLEEVIDISAKQQSKLRLEDKFPIPHKNIGKRVHYSIFHVAEFLLKGEISIQAEPQERLKVSKKMIERANSNSGSLSHIFTMRAMVTNIHKDIDRMSSLSAYIEKVASSTELRNRLTEKLK